MLASLRRDRRLNYKNKGQFRQEELKKKREEQQVEIRKQKREESIAKRRNLTTGSSAAGGGGGGAGGAADSDEDEAIATQLDSQVSLAQRHIYDMQMLMMVSTCNPILARFARSSAAPA